MSPFSFSTRFVRSRGNMRGSTETVARPGDKRDVTFRRWELEPGWTRKAREKGEGRKFIKLRSNCPERSWSNWKKSDFQIIDFGGCIEQAARYLFLKYHRAMLNPALCDVCFVLDALLAVLSEIKQYRHEAQKSHDKWWNYDNYSAASVILGIFVANFNISSRCKDAFGLWGIGFAHIWIRIIILKNKNLIATLDDE